MTVPGALQNPSDFRGSRCLAAALSHGKCSAAAKPQSEAGTLKFPQLFLSCLTVTQGSFSKPGPIQSKQTSRCIH